MADDVKIIKESAGRVRSPYSQASDTGATFELMRAGQKQVISLISGTVGADTIEGTDGPDIIMSNGAQTVPGARIKGNDSINGGKGIDMVVLPGAASDWTPKVPGATDYPQKAAKQFWEEHPQQAYGSILILENKKDGSTVSLRKRRTGCIREWQTKF